MSAQIIINVIAIILSPIIAVIIGEVLRKKNFEKLKRLDVFYNLVAYRYKVDSDEFLQALNSLKIFFAKDEALKKLINGLHVAFEKRDNGEINTDKSEQIIIEIIKRVCYLEGFKNITGQDISHLFKKK